MSEKIGTPQGSRRESAQTVSEETGSSSLAAAHLAVSDATLLAMLDETLDVGVTVIDAENRYRYINSGFFTHLGLPAGSLKPGQTEQDALALLLKSGILTPEIIEKNKRLRLSGQLDIKDNQTRSHIRLANGRTLKWTRTVLDTGYTVVVSHDVSALIDKEKLLNKALALGMSGYWTYDFATKRYALSKTLQHHFSKEDQARIDKYGMIAITHPDDRSIFRDALKSLSRTHNKFDFTNRTYASKHGEQRSRTSGEIVFDSTGKPAYIQAFVTDVTRDWEQAQALERAKDEAVAASRAKSEFLANMSHEIRTPMNGVLGMAELLANTDIDARQREFVKVINQSSSALLTIINDILDFSKIEAGAMDIDPTPFNLKDAVGDVVTLMTSNCQDKGLEIVVNYPSPLPVNFIGDAGRIRQVITNLVGNAIKFTHQGYILVDINIEHRPNNHGLITVSITDTGIGIEEDKIKDVFEKFTQADGSTTRVYGGTGLGLSISKHLIELMGGRLHVQSELGTGSTFSFSIPLEIDADAKTEVFDTSSLIGKRALIVDDIAVNRRVLTERLEGWGLETCIANDGIEALVKLKQSTANGEPYDFLMLDYLMPGMNGIELATIISKSDQISDVPTLMLSSVDQSVSSQKLNAIGIHTYLVKPVREATLFDAIIQLSHKAQAHKPIAVEDISPLDFDADTVSEPNFHAHETLQSQRPSSVRDTVEILVAEDVSLNQDVVRLMLADTQFNPVFADNGKEAVDIYTKDPSRFSAVLMDVSMPIMDGYKATKEIRLISARLGLPTLPIIALTGRALKHDRQTCLDAGMDDYVTKPVQQQMVIQKLEEWTQTQGRVQALVV